jgi:hypothetical protein
MEERSFCMAHAVRVAYLGASRAPARKHTGSYAMMETQQGELLRQGGFHLLIKKGANHE